MKKQFILIALILLFSITIVTTHAASPTAVRIQAVIQNSQPQDPTIGGIPTSIYYTLIDENGRPLTDVSIDESSAHVTLNGLLQGPVTLAIPNTPLFVALTLDVSTSMQPHLQDMVAAVTQAVNSAPNGAQFGLLTFDHQVKPPEGFLIDPDPLQESLRRITIVEERYTCLYDAANEAAKSLEPIIQESPAARRAVILFTDGENRSAPNAPCHYNSAADVKKITKYAQKNQIAIYTISFGRSADISLLETLAQETGGIAFTGEGSLEQKFADVMRSLNSQRVAHTTLFPETEGKHTLTFNLRVRGDGQTAEAIEAGSVVIETKKALRLTAFLELVEHRYERSQQHMIVTLAAKNTAAIDCLTIKLRDMETKETVGNRQICKPKQGKASHFLENLPQLVDGREYRLEIEEEQEICPRGNDGIDNNPCHLTFIIRVDDDPPPPFTFDIKAQPNEQQIIVTLRNLDTAIFPRVEYTIRLSQDGNTIDTLTGLVQDSMQPFVVPYYPQPGKANGGDNTTYNIHLTLSGPNGEIEATKDVAFPSPDKVSYIDRFRIWLNQRPFLSTSILFLLIILPLLYFGRGWLERRLPATRFLISQGVNGRSSSPIKPVTQLPEASWSPPSPPTKPAPPQPAPPQPAPPQPAPTQTAIATAMLHILQAPEEITNDIVVVDPLPFRIGREDCHLTIGDERTSRTHAAIQRIGRQYFIMDMESKNGTFINDESEMLAPGMRWPLTHGDRIRLGATVELVFTIPNQSA